MELNIVHLTVNHLWNMEVFFRGWCPKPIYIYYRDWEISKGSTYAGNNLFFIRLKYKIQILVWIQTMTKWIFPSMKGIRCSSEFTLSRLRGQLIFVNFSFSYGVTLFGALQSLFQQVVRHSERDVGTSE